jgi:hypothetical protein
MSKATDALREFAEKWARPINSPHDDEEATQEVLSDLTALINENYYPKEFIVFCDDNFYWDKGLGGYLPTMVKHQGIIIFKTTDELLTYWEGIK